MPPPAPRPSEIDASRRETVQLEDDLGSMLAAVEEAPPARPSEVASRRETVQLEADLGSMLAAVDEAPPAAPPAKKKKSQRGLFQSPPVPSSRKKVAAPPPPPPPPPPAEMEAEPTTAEPALMDAEPTAAPEAAPAAAPPASLPCRRQPQWHGPRRRRRSASPSRLWVAATSRSCGNGTSRTSPRTPSATASGKPRRREELSRRTLEVSSDFSKALSRSTSATRREDCLRCLISRPRRRLGGARQSSAVE